MATIDVPDVVAWLFRDAESMTAAEYDIALLQARGLLQQANMGHPAAQQMVHDVAEWKATQ